MQDDKWYTFIDDDNLLLDDTFLYEIPYYEERGFVGCNPVLFTRQGRSTFTTIMDWIRYFEDITVFRFFTGLTKRPWIGQCKKSYAMVIIIFNDISGKD